MHVHMKSDSSLWEAHICSFIKNAMKMSFMVLLMKDKSEPASQNIAYADMNPVGKLIIFYYLLLFISVQKDRQ